jgi:glycogen phosphorylase
VISTTCGPIKFINVTNGVTPRRWLAVSNPEQSQLMTSKIGDGWIANLEQLKQLESYAEDSAFRAQWRKVQHDVKVRLAQYIQQETGFSVDPSSMFDSQVKRIHEYKRQHLNVLYILTLYLRLKRNPKMAMTPRTFLFGGKAAAGYAMAKLIIKLINSVAEVINHDPEVKQRMKVFSSGLQRHVRAKGLPRGGPERADIHRRQRGIRNWKHEVRREWGAYDWDSGRR